MEQVLICLKKNGAINLDVLDGRQKELVALGNAIRTGDKTSIRTHVEKAFDAGASREDVLKILTFIVGDVRLFGSILDVLRSLRYEENRRAPWISVVADVREED